MTPAAVDPAAARDAAREILAGRRFRDRPLPRPLRGPLEWLGDRLRAVAGALGDAFAALPPPARGLLALAAAAGLVAGFRWAARRRGARPDAVRPERAAPAGEDPAALEAAAADAQRRGDLDRALRLRFRAGLLRLDRDAHAIRYRPSLTTGDVRRALGSETFDDLARAFEEVAYGGRAAGAEEVDTARAAWPRLVREAAGRAPRGGR